MEKKILAYEKFIEREAKRKLNASERRELAELHAETVANFQHERLIHLIITLFFAGLSMIVVFAMVWCVINYGWLIEASPLYLLAAILVVLTGFYVRHYYFLENHVQGLYKYTEKLRHED